MTTLMTIDEIQQELDREFLPLEPMVTGLRLINGGVSELALVAYENQLNIALPDAFRKIVKTFDFGRLTIGPIVFCKTGDYLRELVQLNTETNWRSVSEARSRNLLVIANSDPYTIALDLGSGNLMAADGEIDWLQVTCIAKTFDLYLRGIGSAMLRRNGCKNKETLAQDLSVQVDGDLAYWSQLIK
jgi:hypothetical protein